MAASKVTIYNLDSAEKFLPAYNVSVAAGASVAVTPEDAEKMLAAGGGGFWSKDKPGGKK